MHLGNVYERTPDNWKEILVNIGYYDDYSDSDDSYDSYQSSYNLKSLQNNPNNIEYWKSRGWSYRPDDWYERVYGYDDDDDGGEDDDEYYSDEDESDEDYEDESYEDDEEYEDETDEDDEYYENQRLKSLQNNPNNIEYWRLRGFSYRPANWHELAYEHGY